jgi:hypothetical protein
MAIPALSPDHKAWDELRDILISPDRQRTILENDFQPWAVSVRSGAGKLPWITYEMQQLGDIRMLACHLFLLIVSISLIFFER